jgi:hypothetical protein
MVSGGAASLVNKGERGMSERDDDCPMCGSSMIQINCWMVQIPFAGSEALISLPAIWVLIRIYLCSNQPLECQPAEFICQEFISRGGFPKKIRYESNNSCTLPPLNPDFSTK